MARQTGSANFAGTLEVLAGGPIDARTVVDTVADLTASGTFPYPYEGLTVYVKAVDKKYTLTADDPTVSANWVEDGSGGGGEFDLENATPAFTEAETRANIASGEKMSVILGKIKKFFTDLKTVAFSGAYSDLSGTPNLATVATSGAYSDLSGTPSLATVATSGNYGDLNNKPTIPDELADLTADSTHRVVTDSQISTWNGKQDALTAGNNIAISSANVVSTTSTLSLNYSTSEQVIGTWIGGATLYQKTINFGALPNATTKKVATGVSGISYVYKIEGIGVATNDNIPIPHASTISNNNVELWFDRLNNKIVITGALDLSSYTGYITIQYTKS